MDRTDREHRHQPHRQSSLPSSLIPHLYSGPQQPRYSQTRTTLQKEDVLPHDRLHSCRLSPIHPLPPSSAPSFDHHRRQLPPFYLTTSDARDRCLDRRLPDPASTPMHRALDATPPSSFLQRYGPIYSDPVYHSSARPSTASNRGYNYNVPPFTGHRTGSKPQTFWRDAGPSSLRLSTSHDEIFPSHRLGSRPPFRVDSPSLERYKRTSPGPQQIPPIRDYSRQTRKRDSYHQSPNRSWHSKLGDYAPQAGPSYERSLGPAQALDFSSNEQSSSREKSYESQDSYSAIGSVSVSAVSPSYAREQSPDIASLRRTVSCSVDVVNNDFDVTSRKGKRRREDSVEPIEPGPDAKKAKIQHQKGGSSKKTAVACNFCRGRKLRCNGDRPRCHNCEVRNFECEYVPIQRRRGPGKAPKGSRSKKINAGRPGSTSKGGADRPSSMIAEHELEALAPEVRPYMSVLSLNSFGHSPPPYPQQPRTIGGESSHQHSRRRTSRSPETSSWEGESDAERHL